MAKKLNYADMAAAIITQLGTQENLTNINHCATDCAWLSAIHPRLTPRR